MASHDIHSKCRKCLVSHKVLDGQSYNPPIKPLPNIRSYFTHTRLLCFLVFQEYVQLLLHQIVKRGFSVLLGLTLSHHAGLCSDFTLYLKQRAHSLTLLFFIFVITLLYIFFTSTRKCIYAHTFIFVIVYFFPSHHTFHKYRDIFLFSLPSFVLVGEMQKYL